MSSINQQELVEIIRGVHEKLRKSYFQSGDLNKVWNDHIAEENLRRNYSQAMFKLATEVWDEKESRIKWTYEICLDYFINGSIERYILRELKIKHKWLPQDKELLSSLSDLSIKKNTHKNLNRKLKLLDVGSCYNPFSKFSIFSCIAIDLTPARKDVIQCDFLALEINEQPKENNAICNHSELFTPENFDVVVFSLVLEYLPGQQQRLEFCLKAWKLLQENGLLIIITPDSKHLQCNAPMIKNWKIALEKIGFIRIKYQKLTHLHCMAFRKISNLEETEWCFESLSQLMYIPQDFKKYEVSESSMNRTHNENSNVLQQFLELPNEY